MNTVLGIDLGTQSLKVVFYDYEARSVVASASAPLDMVRRPDGTAEQDANWWTAALAESLAAVPEAVRMSARAIGVSGQQHGFVALGDNGQVLAPVKLWCDTSTQAEVAEMTAACGGRDEVIRLSGNPLLTGYTAPKIRWLRKHRPELYRRMAHILLPHDYLNFILTGVLCMEYGDASGTGLLDVRTRQWSRPLLSAVDEVRDLAESLPALRDAGEIIGNTTAACADRFGLPAGVPVATGGGDNMMGAIGTGNVSPGKLTMSLGSSGTLYTHADTPIVDPAGGIAAFCSSTGGWLPLVCTMNCTLGIEMLSDLLGTDSRALDVAIEPVEAGSDGLVVVPFFNGERTPDLPNAKGSILGLASHNCSQGHLLRATVEGATFALKFGLDRLVQLGIRADEIVLTGGGANSRAWRQIVANVCNLPVSVLHQDEGASFGAALQALWSWRAAAGETIGDTVAEHLSRNEPLCNDPEIRAVQRYVERYEAYQAAVRQVTPLYT